MLAPSKFLFERAGSRVTLILFVESQRETHSVFFVGGGGGKGGGGKHFNHVLTIRKPIRPWSVEADANADDATRD